MKNIPVLIHDNLFKSIGATPAELYLHLNENSDIRINGSIAFNTSFEKNTNLLLKASVCTEDGSILYILKTLSPINGYLEYETFELYCNKLSRFVNVDQIDHILLYPSIIS